MGPVEGPAKRKKKKTCGCGRRQAPPAPQRAPTCSLQGARIPQVQLAWRELQRGATRSLEQQMTAKCMQPVAEYLGEIEGIKKLYEERQRRMMDFDYYKRKVGRCAGERRLAPRLWHLAWRERRGEGECRHRS